MAYETQGQADAEMRRLRKDAERTKARAGMSADTLMLPVRSYACSAGWWHLTKRSEAENVLRLPEIAVWPDNVAKQQVLVAYLSRQIVLAGQGLVVPPLDVVRKTYVLRQGVAGRTMKELEVVGVVKPTAVTATAQPVWVTLRPPHGYQQPYWELLVS